MSVRDVVQAAAGALGGAATYVEDVFSTYLYDGNGSTQTITNGIDLDGKGGMVWIKVRTTDHPHQLFDTERGVTKALISNTSATETTDTDTLTAFNADGFSLGADSYVNTNAATYASWTFRKAPKFFDVVTYTGNSTPRTIAHNLGSVPGCMIVKRLDTTASDWNVYHRSLGNSKRLLLNSNALAYDVGDVCWNSTTPTDSVFSLGTNTGVNANGSTYVAYLFAHDAGGFGDDGTENVISCGSFTTDGSGNATVDLGYEPQWVMLKTSSDSSSGWLIEDSMRGLTVGVSSGDRYLEANNTNAEAGTNNIELTATGFNHTAIFASKTFIYIAIRRGPMKTPESGTEVFAIDTAGSTGDGNEPEFRAPFAVDMYIRKRTNAPTDGVCSARLIQGTYLSPDKTDAAASDSEVMFDYSNGVVATTQVNSSRYAWMFRRAPGFFDVVGYTGTGSVQTVTHNLGVAPELLIVKSRSLNGQEWPVQVNGDGTKILKLNSTSASITNSAYWNDTGATSTVFTVTGSGLTGSNNATYIAYLFASCPGVSKVSSYIGTGADINVDCGFSAGARFVLIKRTDSTGDWYVWDSARGITAGNDPYLLINSTAAEVTSTDYIDPLSSGFTVTSAAPAALNASGGSYIFLAIA